VQDLAGVARVFPFLVGDDDQRMDFGAPVALPDGQFARRIGRHEPVRDEIVEDALESESLFGAGRDRGRSGGHEIRAL